MAEKKSPLEVVLMPLVVSIVGILGTFFVTHQQEENSIRLAEVQLQSARDLAEADRQIKILEIFSENITNQNNEQERLFALRLLEALDASLAEKLAIAVKDTAKKGSQTSIVAAKVAKEASARAELKPRIYVHIRSESVREKSKTIAEGLEASGFVVPGIERLVDLGPSQTELRYFKRSEKEYAQKIGAQLLGLGIEANVKYVGGYETSTKIGQNHFELWFAPNEPQ